MYIKRHIEKAVLERAREKGAVVVTGARQVGKTTLIERFCGEIPKVSFDDLIIRRRAADEGAAFLQLNPPPLFIDEVQYVPEIFPFIKIALDKSKKKGEFFLTGSQSFVLMQNITESLAGRAGILELLGLSLREIRREDWDEPFLPTTDYLLRRKATQQNLAASDVWEIIHRGGMPELVNNPNFSWENFYADYVGTYIERDVRKLTQVADEASFLRFITVCAALTGQLLNLSSLARDVGISEPTAKRWLSILKTSGIVYLLQPFSNNAITRAVKTPKLYFLDTGLAAYLTRWLTPETLKNGAVSGHFFETFVITELLKSYTNAGKREDFYFLRDHSGREIDLLIFRDNTLFPIEIKTHTTPKPADIKHFSMLAELKNIKIGEGGVISMCNELLPLTEKHKIIPLWAI